MFKPLSIRYGGVDLRFAQLFYVGGALLQLDLRVSGPLTWPKRGIFQFSPM